MAYDEGNHFKDVGSSSRKSNPSYAEFGDREKRLHFDQGPFFSYSSIENSIYLPSVLTDRNKFFFGSSPIDKNFSDILQISNEKIIFCNKTVRERFDSFSKKVEEINPIIFSMGDIFSIFEYGCFKKVVSFKSLTDMYGRNKILISVLAFDIERDLSSTVLQDVFGFTPAEGRLAVLLVNGKSVIECADELGVRISTVREKLSNLFAKTRTSRQPELVSMLSRLGLLG